MSFFSLRRAAPIIGVAGALALGASASAAPIPDGPAPGVPILSDDGRSLPTPTLQHHAGAAGHLPPTQSNVELISRLQLRYPTSDTNFDPLVAEQVTDVAVHKSTAYIGSWRVPNPSNCTRGGFWTVDISDPANPRQLTFMRALEGNYHTEGVHAISVKTPLFNGDLLAVSNEFCVAAGTRPAQGGGFDLWDVSDPANPKALARGVGDRGANDIAGQDTLRGDLGAAHQAHSVYLWKSGARAYAVVMDNEEEYDLDIFDVTDPANPEPVRGYDLDGAGFSDVADDTTLGQDPGLHDMIVKEINGRQIMLASYWDGGYVTVDVTDPANARLIADSRITGPDPIFGTTPQEGNAHEAEFSWDNKYIVAADEDFTPYPAFAEITAGANQGYQFGATTSTEGPRLGRERQVQGDTRFVGLACDPATIPAPSPGVTVAVAERGTCGFQVKTENVEAAGYDAIIIFNSTIAGNGCESYINMLFTGYTGDIISLFVTRDTGLRIIDAHPGEAYRCVRGDAAASTPAPAAPADGSPVRAGVFFFDGWGYARLFRNTTDELDEVDQFAVEEATMERYASGYGDLSIHEVATDPTEYLAYSSYYSAGFRVLGFGEGGLTEMGRYIGQEGNNFWGVDQFTASEEWFKSHHEQRLVALSDRDYGLYLFRYTGPGAPQPPVCADQTAQVPFRGSVTISLACTDANGNRLTRSVSGADDGTVSINQDAGTVTYTHTGAAMGMTDRLTVRAADAAARSNHATLSVVVVASAAAGRCGNPLAGTASADNLAGSQFGDSIRGGAGADVIQGRALDDCVFGEGGNDRLWGQLGKDTVDGGSGADRLWGESNTDTLRGGSGSDRLTGGTGNDRLEGGGGADHLEGANHDDRMIGGDGDDKLVAGSGDDRLDGGDGGDVLTGGPGRNRFAGGAGADDVRAVNNRRDRIACGRGRDRVDADPVDRVARDCERVSRTRAARR